MRGKLVGAVCAILILAGAGRAAAECKLSMLGELPVALSGNRALIEGAIGDKKAVFIVDTGSALSLLGRKAAAELGVSASVMEGLRMVGIGGEVEVQVARVKAFRVGQFVSRGAQFLVSDNDFGSEAGLLGRDFFHDLDVEYDFANKMIRLFDPKGCGNRPMAYWSENYLVGDLVPAPRLAPLMKAIVEINGATVEAQLDTGADSSVLSLQAAKIAGIGPKSPGVVAGGLMGGLGKEKLPSWVARFDSFRLGDETIRNVKMAFADLSVGTPTQAQTVSRIDRKIAEPPEMLLGVDFFRAHRIFAAFSQNKLYFTYNGGPVFDSAGQR